MRHNWPEVVLAIFIAWLLSWVFGLLLPVFAPRGASRSGAWLEGGRRLLSGVRIRSSARTPAAASAETVTPTRGMAQVLAFHGTVQREEGSPVPNLYYFAAWTDSGCLLGCDHHHRTVISAATCVSEAGGYVVAVEEGKYRALNQKEEELFRLAYYGVHAIVRRLVAFKPVTGLKPSLN